MTISHVKNLFAIFYNRYNVKIIMTIFIVILLYIYMMAQPGWASRSKALRRPSRPISTQSPVMD